MLKKAALAAIRFYRFVISPHRHPACRFVPSCSAFAEQAVQQYGAGKGIWMTLSRLARCHPFSAGGFDPVKRRADRSA